MEQSFAQLAGCEHEVEMLTGFDELAECVENGLELTPSAKYTDSVLKLHAADEGMSVAGQEGFLDSIKRGAIKVYEWIKALIKAIKEWLFGPKKKEYDEAKKVIEKDGDLVEEVRKLGGKGIDGVIHQDKVKLLTKQLPSDVKVGIDTAIKEEARNPTFLETLKNVRSDLVDQLTTISLRQLDMIGNAITEIKRLDPNGESLKKLEISPIYRSADELQESIDKVRTIMGRVKDDGLPKMIKEIIVITDNVYISMIEGTSALSKLNERAKGNEAEERGLSRTATVLNHVGTISNALRNLVITIDSQLEKAISVAKNDLVKNAMRNAKEESWAASVDYINIMNGALNR
ncbi:hypothetical protein PQD71_gp201 [Kosakonia phage Kc263]|uniref:Uncharacterized protein n=1 Tax=Kosakonia phage Kc263 TaxID=2863194 RepID=A0AAE7WFZ8_9CAUD|nr:hypothetical protein PQD71_gp201 [Kosakonia phage Kc263]QYN80125.1 hypothetical protein [Kosakonia phage Kc263]